MPALQQSAVLADALKGPWRSSRGDGLLFVLSLLQGAALCLLPACRSGAGCLFGAIYLGGALWWCSNTVSHNHLHNPFFRSARWNQLFSAYLTVLLGVPQALWRERHLWHHAGEPARGRRALGGRGRLEVALVGALWVGLLCRLPFFFFAVYLPGYLLGMGLCHLQGRYEHTGASARDRTGVSCYDVLYNLLWFNDGYHAEHHRHPGEHWTRIPSRRRGGAVESPWPPVLRAAQDLGRRLLAWGNRGQAGLLVLLERLALRSSVLQGFMLRSHERAFSALLPALGGPPARVGVVGGGLFPRTVLVLRRLLGAAALTVIDESPTSIACARGYLAEHALPIQVEFVQDRYDPLRHAGFDLLVVPLGFVGDRDALYASGGPGGPGRPRQPLIIHDWIWRVRGHRGAIISLLLLKRLNLVLPGVPREAGR